MIDGQYDSSSDTENDNGRKGPKKKTPADSASEISAAPLDPADVGMTADSKLLYSGKEDRRGRFTWYVLPRFTAVQNPKVTHANVLNRQPTVPEDIGKPAEDSESEKWALIVRRVRVYNDPKKVLSLHSIVIQSPLLKELLTDVLAGYPGVTVNLKRLEFSGRFEPLIHRWNDLRAAIQDLKKQKEDATTETDDKLEFRIAHAMLLEELLEKEFAEEKESMDDMMVSTWSSGSSTRHFTDTRIEQWRDHLRALVDLV